jgi:quinoprotein glucose dehydrogenase
MHTEVMLVLAAVAMAAPAGAQHTLVSDGAERAVEVWAAKGMMQSPVAICLDPWGNLYIAETDRAGVAVTDTRHIPHLNAVEEDLKFRSVEDRRAQIERWLAAGAFPPDHFTATEDRVRVLSDTDGDGKADGAKLFAGGFNDALDGIGAGVLWQNGVLYYTCIPHLWALPDADRNLEADARQSLASGFGVRWCFFGHDLHGLVPGPDGRIYFSMGDRGFNVTTKEGDRLIAPDQGGVFRCWPDGTGLELVHRGLRNPQELAFGELGDLFTGDNNCDSGDRARIVHIVEGGDSGWRQDVQSLEGDEYHEQNDIHRRTSRGPWNREFMWHTAADSSGPMRPAWALPPVEYMCAGPSGIALYPGTGESSAYDGCFFLADFRGGDSSVHAFRCEPDGASFHVKDHVDFFRGAATITDITWGYDGRLYMSDWGGGWSPNPNGVILTVTNTEVHADPEEAAAIAEVRSLVRGGFAGRTAVQLLKMLGHRDQRVRLGAQYEIAARGLAVDELLSIAGDANARIVTRAHAVWALGQIARTKPDLLPRMLKLLSDGDAEVRTQAARTIGDLRGIRGVEVSGEFQRLLTDASARVRLASAIGLARHGSADAVGPLLAMLTENDNADLTLRHGAAYALAGIGGRDPAALASAGAGGGLSAPARLGLVLALRIMEPERAADYLDDPDAAVAIESARAVYDLRLASGLPRLAALLDDELAADRAVEPLLRRAIEANVLLGTPECAERLGRFGLRGEVASRWRRLALERLLNWERPLKREGVWGNWADLPGRPAADARRAVEPVIGAIIMSSANDDDVIPVAYRLHARYALGLSEAGMVGRIADPALTEVERLAILDHLAATSGDAALLAGCASGLLSDPSAAGPIRRRAMDVLARTAPGEAVEPLRLAAGSGLTRDRQHAIAVLSEIGLREAQAAIASMAADLARGWADREVALDVYRAAMQLPEEHEARKRVETVGDQAPRPRGYATGLLASGGDAVKGRELFLTHPSAECIRCHTTEGPATETAPSLRGVGARLKREQLVESLSEPGKVIAAGFGQVSAMPVMTQFLKPEEMRDVVAYLASLDGSAGVSLRSQRAPRHEAEPEAAEAPSAWRLPRVAEAMLAMLAAGLAFIVWRSITRRA